MILKELIVNERLVPPTKDAYELRGTINARMVEHLRVHYASRPKSILEDAVDAILSPTAWLSELVNEIKIVVMIRDSNPSTILF